MQADSHDVLLFSKRAGCEKAIPSLLPFACIKMQKVVSVEIQAHCYSCTEPFSCVGQCNSRSVSLSCGHHGKAAQPGTRYLICWPHFLYPENERRKEMISEVSSSLEMLRFWWESCLGFSAQRRHRWRKTCLLYSLFSMWLKLVPEM